MTVTFMTSWWASLLLTLVERKYALIEWCKQMHLHIRFLSSENRSTATSANSVKNTLQMCFCSFALTLTNVFVGIEAVVLFLRKTLCFIGSQAGCSGEAGQETDSAASGHSACGWGTWW